MLRPAYLALVAMLPVAGTIWLVPSAAAGTYEVWTCRGPDGSPAVVRDEAGGWASETLNAGTNGGNSIVDSCQSGGAIRAEVARSGVQVAPSWIRWIFGAPLGVAVKTYELDLDGYVRRSGGIDGQSTFGDIGITTGDRTDPDYDVRFIQVGEVSRRVLAFDGRSSRSVVVQVGCGADSGAAGECRPGRDGSPARVGLYRGRFLLEDAGVPAVTSVSGGAVTENVWAGSANISVAASDRGGGVYRMGVEVDGAMRTWIGLAGAPCVAWPGTVRTFLSPKPCPSTVGGVQAIPMAELPEGAHTVRVVVEDAAGNQTTAYGPAPKVIRHDTLPPEAALVPPPGPSPPLAPDLGPVNGSPAAADARLRARWSGAESPRRTIRYNQRPTLNGQLTTTAGQPIRDALVRVTITRQARRSPPFERDSLKTDRHGRFRWKQPAGVSSRSIRLDYHPRLLDRTPAATRTLKLQVKASVRLRLSRKSARRGQAVRLTGKLIGRPLPGAGKVVELQARNPGKRWITFRTVRSRKNGRFMARYRFRNAGPARFQMRVRARRSGDYPYATGSSPIRSIAVR